MRVVLALIVTGMAGARSDGDGASDGKGDDDDGGEDYFGDDEYGSVQCF